MARRGFLIAPLAAAAANFALSLAASTDGAVAGHARVAGACEITQSKSLEGKVRTDIKFVNKTSGVVSVDWLDYTGKRVHYDTIGPGGSVVQPTWKTHPWVVLDAGGRCIGYVIAPQAEYDIVGAPGPTAPAPAQKKATFATVVCTIAVNSIDSRCTAQVADATPQRSNPPTGTARFSASKGLVGSSCNLVGTPGSPGISSCTVSYTPPADLHAGEPPPVSVDYSGDSAFESCSGASGFQPASVIVFGHATATEGGITIEQLNPNWFTTVAYDTLTVPGTTNTTMQRAGVASALAPKPKVIAKATFRLRPLASVKGAIKLTATGRRLLAAHKTLNATLTVTTKAAGHTTSVSVRHLVIRAKG